MNKFASVTFASAFLAIVLFGILVYGITVFRDHWEKFDSTSGIIRDTLRNEAVSIEDLLRARKEMRKGKYEINEREIELLRRYEENQLGVLNQSITLARNERQSLVDEISMLVGLLTGFLALIGIGLPILNMAMTREELRLDREKYEGIIKDMPGVKEKVQEVNKKIPGFENQLRGLNKSLNDKNTTLEKLKQELDENRRSLEDGVKKSTEAKKTASRLPILVVQFKLASVLDKRLFEQMKKKGGDQRQLMIELLNGLCREFVTILGDRTAFACHREELQLGIRQFAADYRVLDEMVSIRKDVEMVDGLYEAIENVIKADHSNDDFWTKLEIMKQNLEAFARSLENRREAA